MEFRVIDRCPVPVELAELIGCLKRDVPGAVLQSCYRGSDPAGVRLLKATGKSSQAELYAGWVARRPGYLPANPPDRGSHILLGDGSFGALHAKLRPQQCGMDWDDPHVEALIKAAAARGWDVRRSYPTSAAEHHHLNAFRWPELGVVLGMARGSERASVRHLIRRLGFAGHACGPERDTFDERVDRAVRAYQRKHKLTPDGKVGPRTWAELSKSVAWHKAHPGPEHGPAPKPAPHKPEPAPHKPKPAARPTRCSARGVQLIAGFEGFRGQPYNDPVGLATIGFGHLIAHRPVTAADRAKWGTLTRAAALKLLATDLRTYEHAVASAVRVRVSQSAFDALVSFCYNLGPNALRSSTLLRLLNAGAPRATVAAEFRKWDKAGSPPRALAGLTRRRRAEADLFVR